MIRAMLREAERYYPLGEGIRLAVEYVRGNDLLALAPGRYPIAGDKVFALIQEPMTMSRNEAPFENHRAHADFQMTLRGTEYVGHCHVGTLKPSGAYNAETDVQLYEGEGGLLPMNVAGESFSLFFPEDAHQPYVTLGEPERIKKVVIRIHLDLISGTIA